MNYKLLLLFDTVKNKTREYMVDVNKWTYSYPYIQLSIIIH